MYGLKHPMRFSDAAQAGCWGKSARRAREKRIILERFAPGNTSQWGETPQHPWCEMLHVHSTPSVRLPSQCGFPQKKPRLHGLGQAWHAVCTVKVDGCIRSGCAFSTPPPRFPDQP